MGGSVTCLPQDRAGEAAGQAMQRWCSAPQPRGGWLSLSRRHEGCGRCFWYESPWQENCQPKGRHSEKSHIIIRGASVTTLCKYVQRIKTSLVSRQTWKRAVAWEVINKSTGMKMEWRWAEKAPDAGHCNLGSSQQPLPPLLLLPPSLGSQLQQHVLGLDRCGLRNRPP